MNWKGIGCGLVGGTMQELDSGHWEIPWKTHST